MDSDDLASEYNVIVLGTGLTECIVAAAAARVGKTVLHMDRNDYYGGDWATLNFEGMKKWIFANKCEPVNNVAILDENDFKEYLNDGERIHVTRSCTNVENVKEYYFVNHQPLKEEPVERSNDEQTSDVDKTPTASDDEESNCVQPVTDDVDNGTVEIGEQGDVPSSSKHVSSKQAFLFKEDFDLHWRKFNLDLSPKLLFSRGRLVDLLISSNIARYAEFKCISRVLTYLNGKLDQVPCSRADVFSTKHVTIVEKRMLMKFLTFCADYVQFPEEYEGFEDKTFYEFLKSRKMTSNVVHYIMYSIAMVDETAPTLKGLEATQQFLKSLGHYGNTPFLWPLYGSGELPQCFCRLCAVFGGVYYLKRKAEAVIINSENKCVGIVTQNKRINCKNLIAEASYVIPAHSETEFSKKNVSRAMFLTNKSLLKSQKEQLTLLRLPPCEGNQATVTVIELGPAAFACPDGLFVVHLSCEAVNTAEDDLKPAAKILFSDQTADDTRPKILWALYYNVNAIDVDQMKAHCDTDISVLSSSNGEVDFDHAVNEAKKVFEELFPQEEFLPRAPDPEEIKIDGEDESSEPQNTTETSPNEGATIPTSETRETSQSVESSDVA